MKKIAFCHAATSNTALLECSGEMMFSSDHLKRKLSSPPVLTFPQFAKPFVIEADAWEVAVGTAFIQKKEEGNTR